MVIQRFRPYFTGQGVQLEELSRALARRGVEVTIVTAIRGDDAPARETAPGCRIRRLRSDLAPESLRRWALGPIFAARAAADLVSRRREIDLVHVHGVNDALYTAWAFGRGQGVPVVLELTLTGADDPRSVASSTNRLTALRYAIYRRMDGYVAISPQLADALRVEVGELEARTALREYVGDTEVGSDARGREHAALARARARIPIGRRPR